MTITLDGTLGVTTPAETITGTLAVTGITTVAAGSAALPSIVSTTGTADTGMWFPAADTIAYSTAGTERVRIGSTGLVGIGTTAPLSQLDVSIAITDPTLGEATGVGAIRITNGTSALTSAGGLEFKNAGDSNGYGAKIQSLNSGGAQLVFANRNGSATWTERMRISSGGDVGIGTNSPSGRLHVSGGYAGFQHNSNGAYPSYNTWFGAIGTNFQTGASYLDFWNTVGSGFQWHIQTAASTQTSVMTINSSGQVTVNTTTATGNFTVASTSTTSVPIATKSPASFTTATYWSDSATAAGTGWYHFYATSSSATVQNCIIFGNGNIQNTNNSYGAISDIKLKENIVDATPKLEQLNQVRVVNFNLKSSPEQKQLGVIAQELESIFPGMVDEINDRDADNNILETKTKSVKYSVFVPMLIKAMQEQQVIIETLSARITALETE